MTRNSHSIGEPLFPYETQPEDPQENERREDYRRRLADMLQDPQFRQIEGFPIGEDEDILALSDPPYYTACPNPFLPEILEQWQVERRETRKKLKLPQDDAYYRREPFAADVSEGKNDPIYNAHSYHTKVPHKAIMRYILHYTDPGDVVFDGFCGTGMTGVAAQLCGDKVAVESLGYKVMADGRIQDESGKVISRMGARKAMLNDLSPAATFISYNYNTPVDAHTFEKEAKQILKVVKDECGWMYETWHPQCEDPNRVKAKINYTVWSDVFSCPQCGKEMVFWEVAVDEEKGKVRDNWTCPDCNTLLSKTPSQEVGSIRAERIWELVFDHNLQQTVRRAKQSPVLINYSVGKKRFEKKPDQFDYDLVFKIEDYEISHQVPMNKINKGDKTSDPINVGVTHVHQFFTRRNLYTLATLRQSIGFTDASKQFLCLIGDILPRASKMHKIAISRLNTNLSKTAGILTGTLYIPSNSIEYSAIELIEYRIKDIKKFQSIFKNRPRNLISTASSTHIPITTAVLDYIFIDPPFGSNIMYSELNVIWEAWLKVLTQNKTEAIMNSSQKKALNDYQELMERCFVNFYKSLKFGRWMTIEFHNSQNAVWIAIQEGLLRSGFIVADVRTLDKQESSFNQSNAGGAVKQDLVISVYKPSEEFEKQFQLEGGSESGAWAFVRQHLEQLPLPDFIGEVIEPQTERMPYLLFDRLVAFHLVRGLTVPLSAGEFYAGLGIRFLARDGMYFTASQAAEYDRLRLKAEKVAQLVLQRKVQEAW